MIPAHHREPCADCPAPGDGCPCPTCTDIAVKQAIKELLEDGELEEAGRDKDGEITYRLTVEN